MNLEYCDLKNLTHFSPKKADPNSPTLKSWAIKNKVFFTILFLLFNTSIAKSVEPLEQDLKIGLFNLLKPQEIEIKILGNEIVTLKAFLESTNQNTPKNSLQSLILSSKEKLHLVINSKGINCYLKNSDNQVKQYFLAKKLSLSGNEMLEVFVAKRLTRQIPAKVNFELSNNLLKTILFTDVETSINIITASELSTIENINSKQATESFKALSVAIRSYVIYEKGRHIKEGYDLCDNTHCLLYLGQDALTNNKQKDIIDQAIKETPELVIKYQDKIVPGYFTACCGGLTALPKEVWAGEQSDQYTFQRVNCNYCQKDKFYQWERTSKSKAIWKALKPVLNFQPTINTKLLTIYNQKGVVTSLLIKEGNHQIKLSASKFRHLIGKELGWNLVLSNFYKIKFNGENVMFEGKGFGHNLGLCLAGAKEQARQGLSYSDILSFYFPNTTLSKIN